MICVTTCGSEKESAQKLGWPVFTDVFSINPKDTVIRWGNSEITDREFPFVVNSALAIRYNCRKLECRLNLKSVVDIPETFSHGQTVGEGLYVVRPRSHTAGKNFQVKKGPFRVEYGHYASQFIKTTEEFRVWFVGNLSTGQFVTMRCKRDKMEANPETEYPCRSEWGYRFKEYPGVPTELHNKVVAATKVIGLEAGAADVLFANNKYYFLELNSAPSVDHWRVEEFFKKNLAALIKQKYPRQHEI